MERNGRAVILTTSSEGTQAVGGAMASRLRRGACVVLVGGLGSGKTAFVRGACRGLGVEDEVLSPTFILYEAFDGRLPVVHIDLYRLEHESEVEALGVFDLIGEDTVLLAEWGDRSALLFESADVVVEIAGVGADTPDGRRITLSWSRAFDDVFAEVQAWL